VLTTKVGVSPAAAEITDHVDYFGNTSTYFCVRTAHRKLVVTARSELAVERVVPDLAGVALGTWEDVRMSVAGNPDVAEFTLSSPQVQPSKAVSRYALNIFGPGRSIADCLVELLHRIKDDFVYKTGATTVRSTADDLLLRGEGVCQDFAHLAVGCLRSLGLAARYVSGYIETHPPEGKPKLRGVDASHAWVSVFLPPLGWVDLDPTNDQFVDDRYLITAIGRDYGDVPPLKGVILTDSRRSTLHVEVDVHLVA